MTLDGFRRVLFNAGEQAIADDMMKLQRHCEMILKDMMLGPSMGNTGGDPTTGWSVFGQPLDPQQGAAGLGQDATLVVNDLALCPYPKHAYFGPTGVARTLACTPGPLAQILVDSLLDPVEGTEQLAMFWVGPSEVSLTTAIGHATNPRIDVVEMKLEYIDGGAATRVFSQDPVKAQLDLSPLTANCETIVRARVAGAGGNSISLAFVADGAGTGSLTQNGNALTFHYATGVTTVGNFETAVGLSTLIEVATADGTGGTLTSPGDTFATNLFTGGVDRRLLSQSLNKNKQVQATFQIKQGTAAATPAYPSLTAGYVAVCAVYVPALHNAVHAPENVRDMRMPLGGLTVYEIPYNQINYNGGGTAWTVDHTAWKVKTPAAAGYAYAMLPTTGKTGRIIAMSAYGKRNNGSTIIRLQRASISGGAAPSFTTLAILDVMGDQMDPGPGTGIIDLGRIADELAIATMPYQGTRAPNTRWGTPLWTTGDPVGPLRGVAQQIVAGGATMDVVVMTFESALINDYVQWVRFYVMHGLG